MVNVYPIKNAKNNSANPFIPKVIDEIVNHVNQRIESSSSEGKVYTDFIYVNYDPIPHNAGKEIQTRVVNAYEKEGYYAYAAIQEHDKNYFKMYIFVNWEEDE